MEFDPRWEAGDFIACLPTPERLALQSVAVGAPPLPPGTVPIIAWTAIFTPVLVLSGVARASAWQRILGATAVEADVDGSIVNVLVFPPMVVAACITWQVQGRFTESPCRAPRFP